MENQSANLNTSKNKHLMRSSLIGAIFMMATSTVGPGLIMQTATFTVQLGAAFAFALLISVLIDFVVQLNTWRIVTLTRKRASDIANAAIPGSGYFLAVLIIFGGVVFNVGNIAAAGLGLNAMFGLDPKIGGAISALLAITVFSSKRAGMALDRIMIVLGLVMITMTLYVAFKSHPPVGQVLYKTIFPDNIDFQTITTITTIVGGTIGGYVTYAGAHRLLDQGATGKENLRTVTRAALSGIAVTTMTRYILFLAILGVVAGGAIIATTGASANPAADAFQIAAGELGLRIFGLILWTAGTCSLINASYTSISFSTVFKKNMTDKQRNMSTVVFVIIALIGYVLLGTAPNALIIFSGGFNGLILPLGVSIFMYVGWMRRDLMQGYHYSRTLLVLGTLICILTWYMSISSIKPIFGLLGL